MIKIPLVPQWNLNNGCVCTPDGGFLYAGSRSINFISSVSDDLGDANKTPVIKCFHTRQGILSLDVDPYWGQTTSGGVNSDSGTATPNENEDNSATRVKGQESSKLFAALLQDNSVQIWDFNKGCAILGHKAHLAYMRYMEGNGPSPQHTGDVLISYMCNRNVLSVDNQDIVVYCVASNSFYRRPMFVSPRNHQMTSLKCSPYNENHFAVGTKRGLVLLCDLQKMSTLYTLRGHDAAITSLAWNRIDLSDEWTSNTLKSQECSKPKVFQKQQSKPVKLTRSDVTIDADEIFDIYDYDYLDNEFGAPTHDLKTKNDFSDFVGVEKQKESCSTADFDFAEACQSLKEEINALRDEQPQMSPEHVVSLEDCKLATAKNRDNLSSCGSGSESDNDEAELKGKDGSSDKESSDGSIVRLVCRTPSSEESVDVDGMHRNKQQNIICQAEIHSSQSQEKVEDKLQKTSVKPIPVSDIDIIEEDKSKLSNEDDTKSLNTNDMYDVLLASTSYDGSFCLWNATTGATCDTHKMRSHAGKSKFYS